MVPRDIHYPFTSRYRFPWPCPHPYGLIIAPLPPPSPSPQTAKQNGDNINPFFCFVLFFPSYVKKERDGFSQLPLEASLIWSRSGAPSRKGVRG